MHLYRALIVVAVLLIPALARAQVPGQIPPVAGNTIIITTGNTSLPANTISNVLPILAAQPSPTATGGVSQVFCANPSTGSDSNTGIVAGTYPNFTNCKKTIEAACNLLTPNSFLYLTGIFHDPTVGTSANVSGTNVLCTVPNTSGGPSVNQPTLITSYGVPYVTDSYSQASNGAWIDGADCIAQNTGDCVGQTANTNWTLFSSAGGVNIYTTPFTQQPLAMYQDNITTWPDGPNADGAVGLQEASCVSAGQNACATATPGSNFPFFVANHAYPTATTYMQASNNNITQVFVSNGGFTSGATTPSCQGVNTCQVGVTTESDGTGTWTFLGAGGAKQLAMTNGSWFWDGQKIYISTSSNDSPANHVIEAADHYQGVYMNANGAGANNYTISHIGIRHTQDGLLWRNNSSSVCLSGDKFLYNIITQTGESNVDLGNFCNGFRIVGSNATCSPAAGAIFEYNAEYYNGDHGGQTTVQAGANQMLIGYNHYIKGNHASINMVGTGVTGCSNCTIQNNYIEQDGPTANQAVANDSVLGIFLGNGTNANTVVGNYIHNMFGSYCLAGQCVGINSQGNSGNTIENNTESEMLSCLYTSSTTTLTYIGNVCNNIVNEAVTGVPIFTHTGEIATSNFNVLPGTNVASVSGVSKNMAAWQGLGFDAGGVNASATFLSGDAYPWSLTSTSAGVGLLVGQGAYGLNSGANQAVNGLTP